MFDISTKKVAETATLDLLDADESPLLGEGKVQCSVTVFGPGSAEYAKAEAKKNNKVMDRLKRKGKADATPEEQRAQQADFLADITASFNGFTYTSPDGATLEGRSLYRAAYMDRGIGFIADQVQAFVGDWGNFSGKSATN